MRHMSPESNSVASRLAARPRGISEATIQADVRQFILSAQLNLTSDAVITVDLESPLGDGTRRRIDIEAGYTVIEIKRDLDQGNVRALAETQLGGYLKQRSEEMGARALGVLTDGRTWRLYVLEPGTPKLIPAGTPFYLNSAADAPRLSEWLGAILATRDPVTPTPYRVASQLGADSPAYAANHETLRALLVEQADHPEIRLKRELWVKLLRSAFGSSFTGSDSLFVDHTLLVLTSKIVAHAVTGFDISGSGQIAAPDLTSGRLFTEAGVLGVVEPDFFDWPALSDDGQAFIAALARSVAAFNWEQVDHDVLKHLYESVISTETRRDLGEYYTPDWLADRVINNLEYSTLESRVLDASCGSGTFLFHAIQRYLTDAESQGVENGEALRGVVSKVIGMDLHPVAVSLARVTYLLAIGRDRLSRTDRPESLSIPVYLGDSLQWERDRATLFSDSDTVSITTSGSNIMSDDESPTLFGEDTLDFPIASMRDSHQFDLMVTKMSEVIQAGLNMSRHEIRKELGRVLRGFGQRKDELSTLVDTGERMWNLHISGRNHIWGYYVRNLVRPVWLSLPDNRVDVLIGNPPWLRYNKMTPWMQDRYRTLGLERGLISGALGSSGRDLAQLFVVRASEMYLKIGGTFGYVVPHSLLTRRSAGGFRTGKWSIGRDDLPALEGVCAFSEVWDLQSIATGFPIPSGVIFGALKSSRPTPMPQKALKWSGRFNPASQPWASVKDSVETIGVLLSAIDNGEYRERSPYASAFRQGAILVPRRLMFVEPGAASPLGSGAGRVPVVSRTTNQDKMPWRVDPLAANVGTEYIRPVLLGESVAPYRIVRSLSAVLPLDGDQLLSEVQVHEADRLNPWWNQAERLWRERRKADETLPLCQRIDFHGQLSAQLDSARPVRIVYAASGNSISASVVTDALAIIEHGLYWSGTESLAEARYLAAILNSRTLLERVKPLQAIGLFGPRHFDKYVFEVPFPGYDSETESHQELVSLAIEAEECANAVALDSTRPFQAGRAKIRHELYLTGIQTRIDEVVDSIVAPTVGIEWV